MRRDGEATAPETADPVADRVQAVADGLAPMVARAEEVQRARATAASGHSASGARGQAAGPSSTAEREAPRWTDVFTTQFTEFSNRPGRG